MQVNWYIAKSEYLEDASELSAKLEYLEDASELAAKLEYLEDASELVYSQVRVSGRCK